MNRCSQNRKLIACLVMEILEEHEAQTLRLHLQTCETCRHYHEEVAHAARKLNTIGPNTDVHASNVFHQRVMGALRAETRRPAWQLWLRQIQRAFLDRRVAFPILGTAVVLVAAWCLALRQPHVSVATPVGNQEQVTAPRIDPEPTISNYQTVANQSLEKLDELLNRQATRNPAATPIYTASALAQLKALD
jgi:anti-sigma factor RsiW